MPSSSTDPSKDQQFLRVLTEMRNRYMRRPVNVSVNTTLGPRHGEVRVAASGGPRTITLPLAESMVGREYTIKKVDVTSNAVTVQRSGSDLIDGANTATLSAQWDSITVKSNGDNRWDIISRVGAGGGGGFTAVTKSSDEATSSDTTLSADGALVVPLQANSKYHLRGRVFLSGGAGGDYKYGLAYTGTLNDVFWHRRHSGLGDAAGTDNETTAAGRGSLPSSVSVP